MTRLERIAHQEARAAAKVEMTKAALAHVQHKRHVATRKERTRRRYQVGTLAEAHGLCALDDTTLAGLFRCLATLTTAPDPVALLDRLMGHAVVLGAAPNGVASLTAVSARAVPIVT